MNSTEDRVHDIVCLFLKSKIQYYRLYCHHYRYEVIVIYLKHLIIFQILLNQTIVKNKKKSH